MDGHHDAELRLIGVPQAVVAALHVVDVEATALERAEDIKASARRQAPAYTIASLTLTGSARGATAASLSGSGRPSFCRLSR